MQTSHTTQLLVCLSPCLELHGHALTHTSQTYTQLLGRCLSASHPVLDRLDYVASVIMPLLASTPWSLADIANSSSSNNSLLHASASLTAVSPLHATITEQQPQQFCHYRPMHGPAFLLPHNPLLPPCLTITALSLPKIIVTTPSQFDAHFPGFWSWK